LPSTPAEAILVVLVTTVLVAAFSVDGAGAEQPLTDSAAMTAAQRPGKAARKGTTRR